MPTTLYLLAILPIVGGLLYLLAVVRMWRESHGLAIGMFLLWPVGIYALITRWRDPESGIRVPMLASIAAFSLWGLLLAWGLGHEPLPHAGDLPSTVDELERGESDFDRNLRASVAMAHLPYRSGRVEIAEAHALIDVPTHFRYADRAGLLAAAEQAGGEVDDATVGWLVHSSVNPADANAWVIEVDWLGDGYINDAAFAVQTAGTLIGDAQEATARIAESEQGDADSFRLVGYAESPKFDAASHSATWVEEIAHAGKRAHRLDCHAVRLGRGGALLFTVADVDMSRQELCLRAVRLAAARTTFEAGQGYADYSRLFDRAARYDLADLVTGAALFQ